MKFKKLVLMLVFLMSFTAFSGVAVVADNTDESDYRIVEKDKTWRIDFNRTIDLSTIDGNVIYIRDMSGEALESCEMKIIDDKSIAIVNNEDYREGELYELIVKNAIRDIDGNYLEQGRKLRFKIEGEARNDFYVKKSEYISPEAILIEFSREVDLKSEVPVFYELRDETGKKVEGSYDNFSIKMLEDNDNMVILTMINKKEKLQGDVFLKVSGEMTDAKGRRFQDGNSEWNLVKQAAKAGEFDVASLDFIGDKVLEVKFNRMIDKDEAQKENNFKLYGSEGETYIINECLLYDDKTIRMRLKNKITDIGEFKLFIKKLPDYTGYSTIKSKEAKFSIDAIKANKIIYEAKTINKRMIEIKFAEKLDKKSAESNYNFFLETNEKNKKTYISEGIYFDEITQDRVILYFAFDLMDPVGYRIKVMRTLKNSFGDIYDVDAKQTLKSSSMPYVFDLEDYEIEGDYVTFKFTNEILIDKDLTDEEYYELVLDEGDGRKITIQCNDVELVNGRTIRARFEGMRDGESYKLYSPSIKGYFGKESINISGMDIER